MTQVQELLQSIQGTTPTRQNGPAEKSDVNFGDPVREFLEAVNTRSKTATQEVTNVIEGKSEDLGQAMISMEESKLSFQLMLEIRNKLLESYSEIQRMQV